MSRAEKTAKKLLEEKKFCRTPIPVESIAKDLGIRLQFEPIEGKDEISGMLFKDGNRTIIGVNSAHPKTRQRFTIAHEIGHLLLHRGELFLDANISFRDSRSSLATDQEEIEANSFAAELLMPRELLKAEVQKRVIKYGSVSTDLLLEELIVVFDVSKQAMEYRLKNLGILFMA